MSYIGREPQIGNFQVCDAISTVNNQAAYTMQVGGVNVSPETANHMLVSLNGILQAPTTSYTVSGSTITFAANLVTGDVINFIQILGSVLDLGVPSDSTVSIAKLTATGTKNSTTFLRGDNTFAAAGGDNTPAFEAYLSSTQSGVSDATATKVQFNTEVFDTDGCYDNSSNYRFTPTTAGKYYIYFVFIGAVAGVSRLSQIAGQIYKNGSVYTETSIDNRSAGYGLSSAVTSVSTIDMNGSSDYVECYGYVNDDSGGTVNFYGDGAGTRCVFGGYKLIT